MNERESKSGGPGDAWSHPLTPAERALQSGEAAETWHAFAQLCAAATPQTDEARLLQALRRRLGEEPPSAQSAVALHRPRRVPVWAATVLALAAVVLLAAAVTFWPRSDKQTAQPPTPENAEPEQVEIPSQVAPVPELAPSTEVHNAFASDPAPASPDEGVASAWEWEDAAWDQDLDAMEQSLSTFRTTWAQGASASATLSAEMESFAAEIEAGAL